MVLCFDHHVVGDLVPCDGASKDSSPQGIVTFGKLQPGCGVCCFLYVYATEVGALDMQVFFLAFDYYNHEPSIE